MSEFVCSVQSSLVVCLFVDICETCFVLSSMFLSTCVFLVLSSCKYMTLVIVVAFRT